MQSRSYEIGPSRLTLQFGDITTSRAQVLVSSDDHLLSMGGGVSGAIRKAGGAALELDVAKRRPPSVGDVVVTSAGTLQALYVFHAVTIGPTARTMSPELVIRNTTKRCLELTRALNLASIAFPAIGTGVARFSLSDAAATMADVVAGDLLGNMRELDVTIFLFDRFRSLDPIDYIAFFEEVARRIPSIGHAPVSPRSPDHRADRGLGIAPSDISESDQRLLDLEKQRQSIEGALRSQLGAGADLEQTGGLLDELISNLWVRLENSLRRDREQQRRTTIFISYAHEDEELRERLGKHLASLAREGLVSEWNDREIVAGSQWGSEIHDHLNSADLVLLLISADFMASDYCTGVEMNRALERGRSGEAVVIPVILRPTDWKRSQLGRLQVLPKDGKPVVSWPDPEEALLDIVEHIRTVLISLK